MKKNTVNFWIDILIFIHFVLIIFTGVLLREFPPELKAHTVLGVTRYDWGDLHWVMALSLIFFIILHLVLHWSWAKLSFKRYLRIGPKTLAITATVIVIVSAIVAPVYLTREFPDRKDVKAFYLKAGSTGLEDYGNPGKPIRRENVFLDPDGGQHFKWDGGFSFAPGFNSPRSR
jgi:hypothetical protein